MIQSLIIGFGNELRGDDGVGPAIARAVDTWNRPDVRTVAICELTPELAEQIAQVDRVLFLDAAIAIDRVSMNRLESVERPEMLSHTLGPCELLKLTEVLFRRCPPAWLLTAPASEFDIGASFSPQTERCISDALRRIGRWIDCEAGDA